MNDAFSIFDVPRRPWLDPKALDERYQELASERHPDTAAEEAGDEAFADLSVAWRTLCEPPSRLRHLLALEFPGQPIGMELNETLPEELVELFMDIGSFTNRLKIFIEKLRGASTDLSQALLAPEGSQVVAEARELLDRVYEAACELDHETRELDQAWVDDEERDGVAIASLQQRWALVVKWRNKLREDLGTLDEELGKFQ